MPCSAVLFSLFLPWVQSFWTDTTGTYIDFWCVENSPSPGGQAPPKTWKLSLRRMSCEGQISL